MKITLCMIVRDEEKYIEECLKKAFMFADDAIIVDTGSEDKTIEIINKFRDKITLINYKWEKDFSKARNISLSKATGDWIFVLDADEIISGNFEKVREILKETAYEALTIPLYNIMDEGNAYFSSIYCKLFKNKGYIYSGAIHEQLNLEEGKIGNITEEYCKIAHYGYLNENKKEKNKIKRNYDILINELHKNPSDPFVQYNLGVNLMEKEDYKAALNYFIKCQQKSLGVAEYHIDMVRRIGKCLFLMKNYNSCINFLKDMLLEDTFIEYVDLHYILGTAYYTNKEYELAEKEYRICIKLGESTSFVSQRGLGSFQPKLMLAKISKDNSRKMEAINLYLEGVFDINNSKKEGLQEFKGFLIDENQIEILNELNRLVGD